MKAVGGCLGRSHPQSVDRHEVVQAHIIEPEQIGGAQSELTPNLRVTVGPEQVFHVQGAFLTGHGISAGRPRFKLEEFLGVDQIAIGHGTHGGAEGRP